MKAPALSRVALLCAALMSWASPAATGAHPNVVAPLVVVEVYDRADGRVLEVYEHEGRRYVIGAPGHEYTLRIRNTMARRVLAVTSVDGVNVVTGETASPDQSGYVIDAYGSVEIGGWRKSLAQTAAFYFTDLGDSYAARTGRPRDVGVIGVAVFPEKPQPVLGRDRAAPFAQAPAPLKDATGESAAAQPAPPEAPRNEARADGRLADQAPAAAESAGRRDSASKLGTGHGRYESAPAQRVRFERESRDAARTIAIQYDRRSNLVALGVLPPPVAVQRTPNPFPALSFAPDPPAR